MTTKHGGFKNHKKTYQCWSDMKNRCYNESSGQYKNYGGRGITVCDRWLNSFENFYSDMGDKPEGMSIERIDVNGGYSPQNCKWASNLEQQRNRRNCDILEFSGKSQTRRAWAAELGMSEATLQARRRKGWPIEMVLSRDKFLLGNKPAFTAMQEKP